MKMTKNPRLLPLLIGVLVLAIVLPASALEKVGTTSMQVLKIPVGVRGIGMASALVAGAGRHSYGEEEPYLHRTN